MQQPASGARLDALSQVWHTFAERECGTYSPLYGAIARAVATDEELLGLVLDAPPRAHQPNVLLAAVHYLVLGDLDHPLGEVYARRRPVGEAAPLFRDLCLRHRGAVSELLATRRTQTNECGRSAVLALGLAAAATLLDEPLALLDAGASAGLNLLVDHYRLDYGPHGTLGPSESPVVVNCDVRSASFALPSRLPAIAHRLGIDREPVDVTNDDDVRWLLACVWPDTGRLERTAAAIELARRHRPRVMRADMAGDLEVSLDTFPPQLPVVVVTSWAYAYLTPTQRDQFAGLLEARGRRRPIAWLSAEGHGIVQAVEAPYPVDHTDTSPSVLALVVFDRNDVDARPLALTHPHGAWVDWRASPTASVLP